MTRKQIIQFNRMRETLIKIHKHYQTPEQLRRSCKGDYGLGYEESLEMAYDNLQSEAKHAVNGVRHIMEIPEHQKTNPQ